MIILPAIDLKGGRVVRLEQGRADRETVYYTDACQPATLWKAAGAEWVHVVDLDGAFTGAGANLRAITAIAETGMQVELGGGMRNPEQVHAAFEAGVARVVIGTQAVKDPAFVEEMVLAHGDRIAVGIDAKNGKVAVQGWVETSAIDATELARRMEAIGVKTLIYTDISRDGMLTGPNFDAQEALCRAVSCQIIASGGVSRAADITRFRQMSQQLPNLYGVIVGKALYDGQIDLPEILQEN